MFKKSHICTWATAALVGLLSTVTFTSCNDDDDPIQPGAGITDAQWEAVNDVDIDGQTLIYEFEAPAAWTATSVDEWAHVLTESGPAGLSTLRIKVDPNEGLEGRSTDVNVKVSGYAEPCVLTLRQGEGMLERGNDRYRSVNKWIFDYMSEKYLWNDHMADLKLDYSLDYDQFLSCILNGIAEFDNVNAEDGHWVNGKRENWYTYLISNAPLSRAVGDTNTDSGLAIMAASMDTADGMVYGYAVVWCTPGSPADAVGLKRGDFIDKVNDVAVTDRNFQSLANQVLNGNCTVSVNDVEFSSTGVCTLTSKGASFVSKYSYPDPSIYASRLITLNNGSKVGYINHMGFHRNFDAQVIDVFDQFKQANISDLIIDLRYNPGGHVLSSVVLGTLVAGSAHQGELYVRTTYNKTRTEKGEVGEYRIGVADNPELYGGYDKIPEALGKSLGLQKVFVITSESTASAAELVINGLRGLGLTVNIIGTTTNGKNVGMEGQQYTYRNYPFLFYPITFYCENAKGFKEYSDGFKPDVEFDDSNYYPYDFGTTNDPLTYYALSWIANGSKPSVSGISRGGSINKIHRLKDTDEMLNVYTRRQGGNIQLHE
ncbi:MAG: S41 family peptidase [Bacteroides sp.]|nr:S41 family peptidase [Bacteroides sp.]MCM1414092.1 S41 family peptidase [Bacteroides sp.]MCM1472356.1 S41 family peptidase [Bacteroides sp.]